MTPTRQGKRLFNCTIGCPNYEPALTTQPERGGMCRREPTPLCLGMDQSTQRLIVQTIWANVGPNDWCSHHPLEIQRRASAPVEENAVPGSHVVPAMPALGTLTPPKMRAAGPGEPLIKPPGYVQPAPPRANGTEPRDLASSISDIIEEDDDPPTPLPGEKPLAKPGAAKRKAT